MTPDIRFFEAAAQLIPILLLACLLENASIRFISQRLKELSSVSLVIVPLGALTSFALGESLALMVLATGEPTRGAAAGVISTIATGWMFTVQPIFWFLSGNLPDERNLRIRFVRGIVAAVELLPLAAGLLFVVALFV